MPFNRPIPQPLRSRTIAMTAPAASGLFGISSRREWLYIGETDDIRGALLAYLDAPATRESALDDTQALGFVFELCARAERLGRQDRLVREYRPRGNRG